MGADGVMREEKRRSTGVFRVTKRSIDVDIQPPPNCISHRWRRTGMRCPAAWARTSLAAWDESGRAWKRSHRSSLGCNPGYTLSTQNNCIELRIFLQV